jgi:hypothetical protein
MAPDKGADMHIQSVMARQLCTALLLGRTECDFGPDRG